MTKIYSQGNYIVIEANNERKTFQKKGVGFEIVNYNGLYSLNDKGLPIGDFNYSEMKKEDGSDYATALEFETFLFENTGNFNSGADVSPNYTPENSANKSDSYTASSSTTYASTKALVDGLTTKLDKGTYTGNASDLKSLIDAKISGSGTVNYIPKFASSGTIGNSQIFDNGTNVGIGTSSPTEKLDVNGNVKATQIKDQYGTLKSQRTITITGNTTLSEVHNGAILHVTNTCNITIPTGLDANFQCVIFAKGSIIVTFVNGGVTVYAPSGLLLKTDKMASLFASASNTFNLLGELATS